MSARSLVQDSGAPAWLSTAHRDPYWIAALGHGSLRLMAPSRRISSALDAFRRPLLQIGGANIPGADHAWQRSGVRLLRSLRADRAPAAAYFVIARDEKRVPSLLLSTASRDPVLIAPLAALAPRGSRLAAAYFVVARDEKRVPSLFLSTASRDPVSAKRQDAWPGCVIIQQWP